MVGKGSNDYEIISMKWNDYSLQSHGTWSCFGEPGLLSSECSGLWVHVTEKHRLDDEMKPMSHQILLCLDNLNMFLNLARVQSNPLPACIYRHTYVPFLYFLMLEEHERACQLL